MKVLVINAGSSSLKYQLIETDSELVITKGIVEKIGKGAEFSFNNKNGEKIKSKVPAKNHTEALKVVIDSLIDKNNNFISSLDEIDAVGHRVVHGGEEFFKSVLIDDKVIKSIEKYSELAPLHNPPNLQGILACKEILPKTRQVAVFDTAFHQTMPESAYMYALPYELYEKYGIRRYGFHGTSHRYVSLKAAEFLGIKIENFNAISCHLGNGSSITAIKGGKSVDTSMGFTPLEGVVMGTRSGSIDPAIIFFLMEKENLSPKEINDLLNKKSGLLGLSGISNDLRDIFAKKDEDKRAKIAIEVLVKSIRKYIGAYMVELGRVDSIIFTAGIGENEWHIREQSVIGLEEYGIILDREKNQKNTRGKFADLSKRESKTKILLVPTNEELMIALETKWIVG